MGTYNINQCQRIDDHPPVSATYRSLVHSANHTYEYLWIPMIDTHMYTQSACVCVCARTCAHRTGMFCLAPEFLHVLAHDRETSQFGAAEINNLCWWQQRCGPTSGEDRGPCHDHPTAATVCSSCLWLWSLYLGTAAEEMSTTAGFMAWNNKIIKHMQIYVAYCSI